MNSLFSIDKKVAVITGAGGVLGGSIARHFITHGARVVAVDIREESLSACVKQLEKLGGEVMGVVGNVLDAENLADVSRMIVEKFGGIDILVNVAGGNMPGATLTEQQTIFDMKIENWDNVVSLNLNGTVYPSLIFGKVIADQGYGSIINISSMAAFSAITRVAGYSAAKTAVSNFTQWMAMEMAMKFGDKVRVNAIAPGFFIGDQNRAVLINPDGSLTKRSEQVLAKTPMGRFGDINELNGAIQFLCSDAASFITGVVLPIDGGFSSYSGV
ncbi:MAG: SDR family oxidoreductase [Rikenellaceae bacterium]